MAFMTPRAVPLWQRFALIAVLGIGLRGVLGLEPVWWLAWTAPAALIGTARDGWLTVSDAYGRILARQDSAVMPGSAMPARVTVERRLDTLIHAPAMRWAGCAWRSRRCCWPARRARAEPFPSDAVSGPCLGRWCNW